MNTDTNTQSEGVSLTVPKPSAVATASAEAIVQRTLAEVQVAVMMAKKFPRDKIVSVEKLKNDCCREGLARVAMYSYAKGGTAITGPSIRLAEAAMNAWGNMQSGWRELSRSNGVSEVEAFCWDTEENTRASVVFSVKHWRDTKSGGYPIKEEREIYELCANQAMRRVRACILQRIDGDMIETAVAQCELTLRTKVVVTPDRIAAMLAEFEKFGITQEQIEKRIQRRAEAINPAVMISLTNIYNSVKDGMSKAADWFDAVEGEPEADKATATDKLKDKFKSKAATNGAVTPTPPPTDKEETEVPSPTATPTEEKADGTTPPALFEQLTEQFVAKVTKCETISDLALLRHNDRQFLADVKAKNPPKYNYCAQFYNDKLTLVGGQPTGFIPEVESAT